MKIFSSKYFFSIVHIIVMMVVLFGTQLRGQSYTSDGYGKLTEIIPYRLVPSMDAGYGCWLEIEFIGLNLRMRGDEELMESLYRLVVMKETGEIGFHEEDFRWNGVTYILVKIQVPSPYSVMPKQTIIEVEDLNNE